MNITENGFEGENHKYFKPSTKEDYEKQRSYEGTVIHCKNQTELDWVISRCEKDSLIRNSKNSFKQYIREFPEGVAVSIERNSYGGLDYFLKNHFDIISFEDFYNSEAKERREKQKLIKKEETVEKKREFKVGDKCVVEYTVTGIFEEDRYPIHCRDGNGKLRTFTREGIVFLNGTNTPTLKHIEDIAPKPEFPKWMMVKTGVTWERRKVIAKDDTGYCYVVYGKDKISAGIGIVTISHVKEIEPKESKEEVEPTFNGVDNAIKTKPPIGLMPKNIWDENKKKERLSDLKRAIERYYDAGLQLDPKWVEEYNELVKEVKGE